MATAITFSVDFTGTPSSTDVEAAQMIVTRENDRRAALDPPGTPLPMATNAQLRTSYLFMLGEIVTNAHAGWAREAAESKLTLAQIKELWANATQAQRDAAVAALGGP